MDRRPCAFAYAPPMHSLLRAVQRERRDPAPIVHVAEAHGASSASWTIEAGVLRPRTGAVAEAPGASSASWTIEAGYCDRRPAPRHRAILRAPSNLEGGCEGGCTEPTERTERSERARRILATTPRLSARDALHVAVMQAHDVGRIMSFDRGFDGIPGIERVA